jgi:hypothetical protein
MSRRTSPRPSRSPLAARASALRAHTRVAWSLAPLCLALCLVGALSPVLPTAAAAPATTGSRVAPAGCMERSPAQVRRDVAQCFAELVTTADGQIRAAAASPPPTALTPADIRAAYALPSGGDGMTVAVIDAGGYANAEQDLAVFRSQFGLTPCTTANGCFTKVDQDGGTSYPPDDSDWAVETALDLDAVSSVCPACHLLLVEGDSAGLDDLGTAADTAVSLGARFVSNSYGVPNETSTEATYDHYYDHAGVVVTASTGDTGNVVNWPASSPVVTAVGGTTLDRDTAGQRGWSETAWTGGGSGCSHYEPRPDYQQDIDTGCANKATADVSAVADPQTGLAVYDTDAQGGWLQVGGTSLSSPLIAGMSALAGPPIAGTYPASYPYDDSRSDTDLNDITMGSDGSCGTTLCNAAPGWDGPTGLGTPHGVGALTFGPHADISGVVTDSRGRRPLGHASITASNTATGHAYTATSDAKGHYLLTTAPGNYDVAVTRFGYATRTRRSVGVSAGGRLTLDFALSALPRRTLSGTVTDGSGHGWPMYARIDVQGDPDGPVFTDPTTGWYHLSLPANSSQTLHVTAAALPGYLPTDLTVAMSHGDAHANATIKVDPTTCHAPGYHYRYRGGFTDFAGWTWGPQDGWSTVDNNGNGELWEFDNPRDRTPPPGGDSDFAIVDSQSFYYRTVQNTSLISPTVDLTDQTAPEIGFDTDYEWFFAAAVYVDVSVDGGSTWTNVWEHLIPNIQGHVDIPIPQAAGQPDVKIRLTYTGHQLGLWSVDNLYIGQRTCTPTAGGIVEGVVRAAHTRRAIIGATIADQAAPSDASASMATPDDPALPDGFYELVATHPGPTTLTANADGYDPAQASVNISPARPAARDWSLRPDQGQR